MNILAPMMVAVVLLSGCTLREWTGEHVIRKAELWLDYTEAETSDVRLLMFDRRGELYRDSLMAGVAGSEALVTYIHNGAYRAVSLATEAECAVSTLDGTRLCASRREDGFYRPMGDVRSHELGFGITKGDVLRHTPELERKTIGMSLTVRGVQWIDSPEGLHFEFDYPTMCNLHGEPVGTAGTYRPEVELLAENTRAEWNTMRGSWRTIYRTSVPDFVIRLVTASGEVLYTKNIREQLSEMTDIDVDIDIDILIEFSRTHITCTIADWVDVEERLTVDIEQ